MRYKIVPDPRSLAALQNARDALPLVPGSVEDCCTRIRDRTDVPSRDAARELLTFMQALGLAAETERGFHRTREDPSREELGERFRENVFGAREVLESLGDADGPQDVDALFAAVRDFVPRWERDRHTDWETEWRDRVADLLAWAETFGLVTRTTDGYVPGDEPSE